MIQNSTNQARTSFPGMLSTCKSIIKDQFLIPGHLQGKERASVIKEKITEALGSMLGAGGAAWMALRVAGFSYAYVLFLVSSGLLTAHFYRKQQGWLMMQQTVFTLINVSGVYCWILQN
jgi:hypothetical protein